MYYNDSEPENDWGVVKTDKFAVNPNNKPRIFVIDDFYTDPMALRQFVTSQWYFDDSGFEGLRTRKQFFFHGVKENFEQTIGKKITVWEEHSMNA